MNNDQGKMNRKKHVKTHYSLLITPSSLFFLALTALNMLLTCGLITQSFLMRTVSASLQNKTSPSLADQPT
ncbi:MAG: hypothetical protein ACI9SQ_001869, partial [Rubritalea sp.]